VIFSSVERPVYVNDHDAARDANEGINRAMVAHRAVFIRTFGLVAIFSCCKWAGWRPGQVRLLVSCGRSTDVLAGYLVAEDKHLVFAAVAPMLRATRQQDVAEAR